MSLEALESRHLLAAAQDPATHGVVVIDSALVASVPQEELAGSLVVAIDNSRDVVDQITTALSGLDQVSVLRFISHGSDGTLWFGGQAIDSATLAARAVDVSVWSKSLTADADILLYGCSVASTLDGRLFVEQLGSLTQADVAASTNLTGVGGDATLEFSVGDVTADLRASAAEYLRAGMSLEAYTINQQISSWTNNQNGTATIRLSFDLRGKFYYAGGYLSDSGSVYMYVNGQEVASAYMTAGNGKAIAATVPLRIGNNSVSVSARRGFPTTWQEPDPIILPIEAPYYLGMASSLTVPVGQWQNQFYVVNNAFGTPTIQYSATNLPRGVSIDSRGVILGIPETGTAGVYNVVLQATNGFGTATHAMTVTVTNQAPSFATTTPGVISGATEGTPFTITHAALAAAVDDSDPNNDPLSFRIESVLGGTLTKGGSPVMAGFTLLGPGESIVWTPPATVNGTLDAFTVKAYDGALLSPTAKTVRVSVGAVNDSPTFTQFAGPVATGNEDTVIPISRAALLASADEADIDGSVTAFVVKSVTTGTLRIGTSDATATPWNATTNAAITSSLNAYWTPAANANGAQSAFTAVALDDGGLESPTPVQAVVSVVAVNDSPSLTSVAIISGATASDPFEISYATLANAANAADVDGDAIAFRIEAVSTGVLEKWTGSAWTAVTAGTTLVGSGDKLRWTPAVGTSGLRNAFTVKAWDGQAASATAIQVRVDGDIWRVRPWTDAASSGISTLFNYTHAYSFGAAGGFAVNGLSFTGLSGANPSVAGRLSTTGFGGVLTNDANNLADASRSLANDAVSTSASSASVTLRGLAPGGRYVLSLYTVGRDTTARLATLSSAMGQITVDQNALGTDNGVRIDYQYLADASGSVTISLAVPSAAFSIYGLANREAAPALGLYAPSTLTYDAATKPFQAFASPANPLPFISAGTLHSVVLKADGTVSAFGTNNSGQTTVPAGLANVVAVSAGGYHTMALKSDGTVVAWGSNYASQSTVPAGLSNVVAIAAGGGHSLVLKSDGTVVAWGSNSGGQTNVPAGLTGVVAIAAGSNHSMALKSDGTVVAWGYGFYNYATPPAGLTDFVAISAGEWHSLALKSDGTVVAWGNNGSFQCNVPAGLKGVVAVSAGTSFSTALKSDGTVVAWGDRDNYGSTVITPGLSGVVAIDSGAEHTIALKSDGTVVTFGWIRYGQQTPPTTFGQTAAGILNSYTYSYAGRGSTIYAASATPPTNAGDYTVTATATGAGNTVSVSRDFTIAKVTPSPYYYTRVNTITYGTALSSLQVDTLPAWWWNQGTYTQIPGTTIYSPTIGTVLPAGTHTLQLTFVPTDTVNFNPAVATSTITVQQATVAAGSITLTPPASLTYTGSAKAYTASATGVAGFTLSYSGRAGTVYGPSSVPPTYAGDYTITATVNDPNYQGSKSLDFTIAKAVPTITAVPTATGLTFGQTLASSTLSGGTASVPGTFAFRDSTTQVNAVGSIPQDIVFTPADTVNYAPAAGTVFINVAPLAIAAGAFTFSAPSSLAYNGSPKMHSATAAGPWGTLFGMSYSYTGVAGTTYGPSATAPTNAGSYAVTATLTGTNFTGSATRTFAITQVTPTVTWAAPAAISYGTALSATQLNATASVAGSFAYTPAAGTVLAAGGRTLQAVFTPTDTVNYASVTTSRSLQVNSSSMPISLVPPAPVYDGTPKPYVLSQMAYLSSGWDHSLALRADGTVTAWGSNSDGQTNVPAGLSGVVQVSAGSYHSVAVKSNGTLVTWGADGWSQRSGAILNLPYTGPGWTAVTQRDSITNATAVAAGGALTVVLRADGTVTVLGSSTYTSAVDVPVGLSGVTAVAAGDRHAVALKSDGTVVAWGYNNSGQTDVPAGLSGVVAIAAGGNHTLALKADGTVVAWGNNFGGQTTVPAGLSGVVALTAGFSSSFALKSDGTVVGFGMSSSGPMAGRQIAASGSGVVAFSSDANGNLRLLKSDGTVVDADGMTLASGIGFFAYGFSYAGRSGTTYAASSSAPTNAGSYTLTVTSTDPNYSTSRTIDFTIAKATPSITTLPQSSILAEGQALSTALLDGGVASVPGTFTFSAPAFVPSAGTTTHEITFTPTDSVNYNAVTRTVTVLSQGTSASLPTILSLPSATPITFGQRLQVSTLSGGSASVPGTFVYSSRLTIPNPGTARQSVTFIPTDIASYQAVTFLLPVTVYDGIVSPLNIPLLPPPSLTYDGSQKAFRVARGSLVSSGNYGHFLVVKSDGTVGAFGDNSNGQLNVPAGLTGVVAVAAGESSSMALKADGTVVEWGASWMGTAPAGLSGVVAIARGNIHALALKADGTVVAWGNNSYGQRNVPAGLTGVVAIAGSVSSSFALKSDGTVVAWGTNSYGQMDIPAGLSGVVALSASSYGPIAALKSDGTVVCWGKNDSGQATVPAGLSGVVAVAAGENHTVALKADGTVVAWGGGTSFTPTGWNGNLVPWNLADVVAIDASSDATYAIRSDGSVVWWGQRGPFGAYRVNGEVYRTPSGAGVAVPEMTPLLAADSAGFAFSSTYSGREGTTYAASTTPPTEPGDYSVTVTGTDPDFTATKTYTFTIAKATPSITTAPAATGITYGQSLAASSLSGGTTSVAGSFAFAPPGTLPGAGSASQSVVFTPTDTGRYLPVTLNVPVVVAQATPTVVTLPTATTIAYGQTLASATLGSGLASVPGTFAFTAPGTAPAAGTAARSVTFTPTDAVNYAPVTATIDVLVTRASPSVSVAPLATSIRAGQSLVNSILSGGTASVPGTFAFADTSLAPASGTADQDVVFTPTDTANYAPVTLGVAVRVRSFDPGDIADIAGEAGGVANAAAGFDAVGNVLDGQSNYDGTAIAVTAVAGPGGPGTVGAAIAGNYGSLTLRADGSYAYVVDDANPAVQALAVGGTLVDTFSYTIASATDSATAAMRVTIYGGNDAPAFSTVGSGPLKTVNEDTEVSITFAELLAAGNAADLDGTVVAFAVTSVAGGVLRIGDDPTSAGAWDADSNGLIDATKNAYWTPAANANGTLPAFAVVARDDGGASSPTPVTVVVTVTPVNDSPTLAPVEITFIDTIAADTFAPVSGTLAAADVDADTLAFGITGVTPVGDVFTQTGSYGTLVVNRLTGGYEFTPNAAAINATTAAFSETFPIVVSDGTATTAALLTVAITATDDRPTLSALAVAATPGTEDTATEISFADLLAAGNQADVDGTVTGFVVTEVKSGRLAIGSSAATAAAWDAVTNRLISATLTAFWTPDADANGPLEAFAVVARDNGGNDSTSPLVYRVSVASVNDAPSLTSFPLVVGTTAEDTQVELTFTALAAVGNQTDIDGTVTGFVVTSVAGGTLTIGATAATATPWDAVTNAVVTTGLQAYWTPAANASGTLAAFSVKARDDGGLDSPVAVPVSVLVSAVNDAPVNTVPATQTVNEDTDLFFSAANGNAIAVADVDVGGLPVEVTLSVTNGVLSLAGTTGLTFTTGDGTGDATVVFSGTRTDVNAAFATLVYRPATNFHGAALLTIMASDQGGSGSGGPLTDADTVPISVASVNDAPTDITLTGDSVAENAASGTTVGTVSTADVDAGDTFTYSLVSGAGDTDNASFTIDGGSLKTGASFDFETKASYTFRVRSSDANGLTFEKTFVITVTNVNEAPTDIALAANTVPENSPAGTTVGGFSSTDVDAGDTFTYSLVSGTGDTDNAAFTIVGGSLRTAASFDFETKASYTIRVRSTEAGGLITEKAFTITVTGVNEAPSDIALAANTVLENSPAGTMVGGFSSTDVDAGDTFTYSLVSGVGDTDNASFTIDGGTLKTTASFDFEAKSSYTIRVRSTDAGGLFTDKAFAITVTNVNEPATIGLPVPFLDEVTEDVAVDGLGFLSASGRFTVVDPDASESSFGTVVTAPEGHTNLGLLTIDTAGNFVYRVRNDSSSVQALRAGATHTDSFVIRSLDGTSRTVSFRIVGASDILVGAVADGYLAGATLFADSNGNGRRDDGETWTTTDANGNFSFDFGAPAATLVTIGGTDISTGLPFVGSLSAPAGSTIVNPLTTLVAATIQQSGLTTAAAAAAVSAALGLPAAIDLTTYDPLAQAAGDATALEVHRAAATVANVIVVTTNNGIDTGAALRNLATLITASPTATIDLESSAVLTTVLTVDVGGSSTPPPTALVTGLALVNTAVNDAESISDVAESQVFVQQGTPFAAPAITSSATTTFATGSAGSFQFVATGYPAPTFSTSGTLPAGVTLTSAGLLSGTPAPGAGGLYAFTVTATNGISPAAPQAFTLTVTQTDDVVVAVAANKIVLSLAPKGVAISSLHTSYNKKTQLLTITAVQPGTMVAGDPATPGVTVNSAAKTILVNLGVMTGFAGITVNGNGGVDSVTIDGAGVNLAAVTKGAASQSFLIDTKAGANDMVVVGKPIVAKGSGTVSITTAAANASRGIRFASGVTTATGSQSYSGPVTLLADTVLTAGAGGGIGFSGTVDGAKRLSLAAGASITFADAVGGTTALRGLAVSRAASVAVNGAFHLNGTGTRAGTHGLAIAAGVNNVVFSTLGVGSRTIQNFSGSGIRFAGSSTNSTITGVVSRGNGTGLSFAAGGYSGTKVQNNTFEANLRYGVVLGGAKNLQVGGTAVDAGNRIIDSTAWRAYSTGIQASGHSTGTIVQGNTISGNAGNGLVLVAAKGITIGGAAPNAGNAIHGNNAFGLLATGISNGSLVQGNSFVGNRMGTVNAKAAKGLSLR